MARLRDPEKGCPWDLQQTYASIVPHTLEEAYEVADAVQREHWGDLKEELGDLLLQVVFYAQIAKEDQHFDFHDVAAVLKEKLLRRHPHVFGDNDALNSDEVSKLWDAIKEQEKATRYEKQQSVMDGIPLTFPALTRAYKIQKKAAKLSFDWTELDPVFDKIHEEIDEVKAEITEQPDQKRIESEIGDLLFAVVNLGRHLGVNSEAALRGANQRFVDRFKHMEHHVAGEGKSMPEYSLAELEEFWANAKKALSSSNA